MKSTLLRLSVLIFGVIAFDVALVGLGAMGTRYFAGPHFAAWATTDRVTTETGVPVVPVKSDESDGHLQPLGTDKGEEKQPPKKADAVVPEQAPQALPSDLPTLQTNLRSKDVRVRLLACETLRHLGADAIPAIPRLIEALNDPDDSVRTAAKAALDRIGLPGKSQLDLIATFLGDPQVAVRRLALKSLRVIDCDEARVLNAVAKLLRDPDFGVRQEAVGVVGRFSAIRPACLEALLGTLEDAELRPDLLAELNKLRPMGPSDLTALMKTLKDGSVEARLYATRELGLLGPKAKAAQKSLVGALKDARGELRHLILLALAAIDPEQMGGKGAQVAALADNDPGVRQRAAVLLGSSGKDARDASSALVHALKDMDPDVRLAVLLALEQIGIEDKQFPDIAHLGKDPDVNIRATAIALLGVVGPDGGPLTPQLVEAFEDENMGVKKNAIIAAGLRRGKDAVAGLRKLLRNEKEDGTQTAVIWAIGRIGGNARSATNELISMLSEQDAIRREPIINALAGIGARAVPALIEGLKSRDPWVRLGSVQALGKMGPDAKDAIGPLSFRYSKDPIPDIRAAAKEALKTIQAKEPDPFVYPKAPQSFRPKPKLLAFHGLEPADTTDKPKPAERPVEQPNGKTPPGALNDLILSLGRGAEERLAALKQIAQMKAQARGAARPICALLVRSTGTEREAALEALEKIAPDLYDVCVPLVVDKDVNVHFQALRRLRRMGPKGSDALPLVLAFANKQLSANTGNASFFVDIIAAIAPGSPEARQFVLSLAGNPAMNVLALSLPHLAAWAKDSPDDRKSLVALLEKQLPIVVADQRRQYDAVAVIEAIGKLGADGKAFLPALKKLKLSETATVRDAAKRAFDKLSQ